MQKLERGVIFDPEINTVNIADNLEANMGVSWSRLRAALARAPSNSMLRVYPDKYTRTILVEIVRPDIVECRIGFCQRTIGGDWTFNLGDIRTQQPGHGTMREVFPCLIGMAREFGVNGMELRAKNIGRYSWIKYGFIPFQSSWEEIVRTVKQEVAIGYLKTPKVVEAVKAICNNPDPRAARDLAAYGYRADFIWKPVGKDLLLYYGLRSWAGRLDVNNPVEVAYSLSYCRGKPTPIAKVVDFFVRRRRELSH